MIKKIKNKKSIFIHLFLIPAGDGSNEGPAKAKRFNPLHR